MPPLLGDSFAPVLACFCVLGAYINRMNGYKGPQVVDASLTESILYMGALTYFFYKIRLIDGDRQATSVFSQKNPYYTFYKSKDGVSYSHGGFETKFYRNFLNELGFSVTQVNEFCHNKDTYAMENWESDKRKIQLAFETRDSKSWDTMVARSPNLCLFKVRELSQVGEINEYHRESVFKTPEGDFQIIPGTRVTNAANTQDFFHKSYRRNPSKGEHNSDVLEKAGIP